MATDDRRTDRPEEDEAAATTGIGAGAAAGYGMSTLAGGSVDASKEAGDESRGEAPSEQWPRGEAGGADETRAMPGTPDDLELERRGVEVDAPPSGSDRFTGDAGESYEDEVERERRGEEE